MPPQRGKRVRAGGNGGFSNGYRHTTPAWPATAKRKASPPRSIPDKKTTLAPGASPNQQLPPTRERLRSAFSSAKIQHMATAPSAHGQNDRSRTRADNSG